MTSLYAIETDIAAIALEAVNSKFQDCQGILLCGSAVQGKMQSCSDLDLLIFYDSLNSNYKEVFTYQGYEIEALVYSLSTFVSLIQAENSERKNALKDLCAKSIILKDTDGRIEAVRMQVSAGYSEGPAALSHQEIQHQRYIITNRLDDFKVESDFVESYFILQDLLTRLLDFVLLYNKQWPYTGSGKWQSRSFKQFDKDAHAALMFAIKSFCKHDDKIPIIGFVNHYLDLAGGRLKAGYKMGIPPDYNACRTWYTIEIYYSKPLELLLTEVVLPFFQTLRQNNWIEKCFFNRYTENGTHLTLFLITDEITYEKLIVPLAESTIEPYLKKNPSERIMLSSSKHLPKNQQWFQNNSVQFHHQDVIAALYGGSDAIKLIEDFFEFSSIHITDVIKSTTNWSASIAMGLAIRFSVSAIHALAIQPDQLNAVLNLHLHELLPFAGVTRGDQDKTTEFISSLKNKFNASCDQITRVVHKVWTQLQEEEFVQKCTLVSELKILKQNIDDLHYRNRLLVPDMIDFADHPMDEATQIKFMFFTKLVHAFANQVGLYYADECYLIYIMQNCMHHFQTKMI